MELTIALVAIRLVVGGLFIGHGLQKLFGWFRGDGVRGTGDYFESLGYRHGRVLAVLAGLAEAGGGLSLLLGLFTPLGAAVLMAVMVNAVFAAHWNAGLWTQHGGFEYPLVLGTLAFAFALGGPGPASLDVALGLELHGWVWAVVAVLFGAASSFAALGTKGTTATVEP